MSRQGLIPLRVVQQNLFHALFFWWRDGDLWHPEGSVILLAVCVLDSTLIRTAVS